MIFFSMTHQLIYIEDSPKQPDENLASGIYLIFAALFTFLISNMMVLSTYKTTLLMAGAFSLMGMRLFLIKQYLHKYITHVSLK